MHDVKTAHLIHFAPGTIVDDDRGYNDYRLFAKWTQADACFITNHHHGLGASTIAAIYKDRWQIELFFKVFKQNLKIKTFVGTSANAVKTQIWMALLSMLLLRYLQPSSRFGWGLANLVALLCMNLFTHRDLMAWLDEPFTMSTPPNQQDNPQALLAFV